MKDFAELLSIWETSSFKSLRIERLQKDNELKKCVNYLQFSSLQYVQENK